MRLFFTTIILSLLSLCVFAQSQVDRFASYEEMCGNTVIFYDMYSNFQRHGAYAYDYFKGKYKVLKDEAYYKSIEGKPVDVIDVISVKKKQYLHIKPHGPSFSLYLILDDRINYLALARSYTYWVNEYRSISQEYSFVKFPSTLTQNITGEKLLLDKYLPLIWKSVHMPRTVDGEVIVECNVGQSQQLWSFSDIESNKGSLVTLDVYNIEKAKVEARLAAERRERERLDSIADRTHVCEAVLKHTPRVSSILASESIDYADKDTLYLSVYGFEVKDNGLTYYRVITRYYKGYVLGKDISIPEEDLLFTDISEKEFIDQRGTSGIVIRRQTAQNNDETRTLEYNLIKLARYQWLLERMQALYDFRDQKRILILDKDYSYSTYKFGLKFKVYNCFKKNIKYIDMRVVAFNAVGDPQRDDIGNFAKDIRCIGPLEKGDEGTYDFDELFWDDDGIINRLDVVEIAVTFEDNSKITYTGKDKVELHTELHYGEEVLKILHEGEDKIR